MQHKFQFVYCDCEPLAVTLSRAKLWPATPLNPRFAFSFALFDWAEALLLECQVALKDFRSLGIPFPSSRYLMIFQCNYWILKHREESFMAL